MHSQLTKEINKRLSGMLTEVYLTQLDELDTSFQYKILHLKDFNSFIKAITRKHIRYIDNVYHDNLVTRETIINLYSILNDTNIEYGEFKTDVYSDGTCNRMMVDRVNIKTKNSINIVCQEKISKELDKIINIEHTILIYIN